MIRNYIVSIFILSFFISSCSDNSSAKNGTIPANKYLGVEITNHLPTGSVYYDSSGERQGYRSIVIDIKNDTLVPVNIQIDLPDEFIPFSAGTGWKYCAFLLPDSMHNLYEDNDSLSKDLKLFIENRTARHSALNKNIDPGEVLKLRIGFLISPDGLARGAVFSAGHQHNLTIPDSAIRFPGSDSKNQCSLMIGITLNNAYSAIPCGQLRFDTMR